MIVDVEYVSPDIHRCRKRHYDIPMNTHRSLNLSCDLNRLDRLEREENRQRNTNEFTRFRWWTFHILDIFHCHFDNFCLFNASIVLKMRHGRMKMNEEVSSVRQVFYVELILEVNRDSDSFDHVVVFQSLDEIFDSKIQPDLHSSSSIKLTWNFNDFLRRNLFVSPSWLITFKCLNKARKEKINPTVFNQSTW